MALTAEGEPILLSLPSALPRLIEDRATATPDRVMLVDESGRRHTFAQVIGAARRLAEDLRTLGVRPGTRVAWQLPTQPGTVVLLLALSLAGSVQIPIPHIYRAREVGAVLDQVSADVLITPTRWRGIDFAAMAEALAADRPLRSLTLDPCPTGGTTLRERPADQSVPGVARFPLASEQIRWIFLTSGTSGAPKGAQHTDLSVGLASLALARRLHVHADDRSAVAFPIAHVGGLNWITVSLLSGCRLLLAESFGRDTITFLDAERATLLGSGTAHHLAYRDAVRARPDDRLFADVRAYPGGGSTKPPSLMAELCQEVGGAAIVSGYGMTEYPMITMSSLDDPPEKLAHTEGRPSPGVEIAIRDRLTGEVCRPGEDGQIWVRGPHLFAGYLDPSATAQAMDTEGALCTGDVGHFDTDGYLVITGRTKDIIIRKGENISAKEIEDLLYAHPDVADVAVVGIPDAALGERCCAVIVTRAGTPALDVQRVAAYLDERGVMPQKWPEHVTIVSTLPRSPAGKVLKARLVESLSVPLDSNR